MKKNYPQILLMLLALVSSSFVFAQTNRVKITVNWFSDASQNSVEIYDQANNNLYTITSSGAEVFTATYDLGCLIEDDETGLLPAKYHIIAYDANSDGWDGNVQVFVSDFETAVLESSGPTSGQSDTGSLEFDVNSGVACDFPDTDGDFVIDLVDQDDDNDGILDTVEGLGTDEFNCQVPVLEFLSGTDGGSDQALDPSSTGGPGEVGAVYRFTNASEGYDVLVEIMEITNASLEDLDNDDPADGGNVASSLETTINFESGINSGITFRFTLVDTGESVPTQSLFSIGGTTWDCDGTTTYQESVRYYNPSAYGVDNPTSLTQDNYPDGAGITAGEVTYNGFSTEPILRSYFQFSLDATDEISTNDYFDIRMQLKKDDPGITAQRLYSMSFNQCDIFSYKAPSLTITMGVDTDGDGIIDRLDIDSDDDGIPDNVEAQSTLGYILPNFDPLDIDPLDMNFETGIDTAYGSGLITVDTDADGIFDFLDPDSDNDGIPDVDENGISYSVENLGTDTDGDGLDDEFEGTELNDPLDVNDEIENPSSDLPDTDGDLLEPFGDVDYRDASTFGSATIDFDGIDDYLDSAQILDGKTSATLMAWIKLSDPAFDEDRFVVGQDNFNMIINDDLELTVRVNENSYSLPTALDLNKWIHIAAVYDQSNGLVIYINGARESNESISGLLSSNGDKFTIGKNSLTNSEYFKGSIDEVRVFDDALTDSQIQQMVFQEIEENTTANVVKGVIAPLDIKDFTLATTIPWSNLQAYYDMNVITGGKTFDSSSYNRDAILYNINSIQEQTSPIPYETKQDGYWGNTDIWLNGDVWDIQDPSTVKDWAIYNIKHNVNYDSSIKSFGLIIDNDKSITITDDQEVSNGWYLELNGSLDLAGDSQLLQTVNSELVTGPTGKLLRRQEGNLNYYWYNYWSSPVAGIGAEPNYKLQNIKDSDGVSGFSFTDAFEAEGQISRRWLYTFQNGQSYYDWEQITELSDILPGVGYTQKGISSASNPDDEYQYTFVGKPNNGVIMVLADDIDGDSDNESSEDDLTLTTTLIGNPYPSALDAKKFIQDNIPVIGDGDSDGPTTGTIYLWEQWSGASHYLADYEGGYGTINLSSEVPAYQWNDPASGPDPLAKTPSQFIPVGQGFFVEVITDLGNIEFNNGQRVFKKEAEVDGPIFFRNSGVENQSSSNEDNSMGLVRLELTVSNGNKRNFVLAFSDNATDGYDYGFDSRTIDPQDDDMNSYLNEEKMVIQTYSPISVDKVINLVFNSTGTYNYSLEILEIENIPDEQSILIKDHLTNTEFDLRTGAYNFTSDVNGEDFDRFDIIFNATTLDTEDFNSDEALIFVNNNEHKLYVKGLTTQDNKLNIINMLGQNIRTYGNLSSESLNNGIDVSTLSSGFYIVSLTNNDNHTIEKKVIIE